MLSDLSGEELSKHGAREYHHREEEEEKLTRKYHLSIHSLL